MDGEPAAPRGHADARDRQRARLRRRLPDRARGRPRGRPARRRRLRATCRSPPPASPIMVAAAAGHARRRRPRCASAARASYRLRFAGASGLRDGRGMEPGGVRGAADRVRPAGAARARAGDLGRGGARTDEGAVTDASRGNQVKRGAAATASEALREAIRSRAFPTEPRTEPQTAAGAVVAQGGGAVAAVIFFGSRKTRRGTRPVERLRLLRGRPAATGLLSASPRRPAAAGAPALARGPQRGAAAEPGLDRGRRAARSRAKCAVISLARLRARPRRGAATTSARAAVPADGGPLRADADAPRRCWRRSVRRARAHLRLGAAVAAGAFRRRRPTAARCCASRSRPRSGRSPTGAPTPCSTRSGPTCSRVRRCSWRSCAARGRAQAGPGGYALARPVRAPASACASRAYFRWSLVRATVRWVKYVVTFDDWLDYILRKAHRHTGHDIVLSPRERRLPLVFLWPRVFRYLRDKDAGEAGVSPSLAVLAVRRWRCVRVDGGVRGRAAAAATPTPSARARSSCSGSATSWFTGSCGRSGPVERLAAPPRARRPTSSTSPALLGLASGLADRRRADWRPGGWAIALAGVADILDGRIARARGLASDYGKFIDSTLDRFVEVFAFLGFASTCGPRRSGRCWRARRSLGRCW